MKLRSVHVFFLIAFTTKSFCQNDLGSWSLVNISVKFSPKWSAFAEGQIRSLSFYDQFNYHEIKSAVSYNLTSNFSATFGIGKYNTYSPQGNFLSPIQNEEKRSWFQFNLKHSKNRFFFDHRLRIEQRFTTNGYLNRYRYRFNANIPINHTKLDPKAVYLSAFNEVFFTDSQKTTFVRNRSFLGVGFVCSDSITLLSGIINQLDYTTKGSTIQNYFNLAFLYNLNLSNEVEDYTSIPNKIN